MQTITTVRVKRDSRHLSPSRGQAPSRSRGAAMRVGLIAMLATVFVSGSSGYAADIGAGKEKAELCAGCHGEAGISKTENIPSLAAQPDQFLQWQLVFFRS